MRLKRSGYLPTGLRRFDALACGLGVCGVVLALAAATRSVQYEQLFDLNSLIFIVVGTISVVFFQYDLKSIFLAIKFLLVSFFPLRSHGLRSRIKELDSALDLGQKITDFPHDSKLTGDPLKDVPFFFSQGLSFDEVDEILAGGVLPAIQIQRTSAEIFARASQLAPSLGLLGTVIGLVGVLRSLGDPSQIGFSMSLALMTTAYGSALGSLVLGPCAGRIDAMAENNLQTHREIIRKLHILYLRSETDVGNLRKRGAA